MYIFSTNVCIFLYPKTSVFISILFYYTCKIFKNSTIISLQLASSEWMRFLVFYLCKIFWTLKFLNMPNPPSNCFSNNLPVSIPPSSWYHMKLCPKFTWHFNLHSMIVGGRAFRIQYSCTLIKIGVEAERGKEKKEKQEPHKEGLGRKGLFPSAMWAEAGNVYVYKPEGFSNTFWINKYFDVGLFASRIVQLSLWYWDYLD